MSTDALTEAHITAQARLRAIAETAVATTWENLPAYNSADVAEWLARVQPIVLAAQRQSVAITNAYLARAMERQPLAVDVAQIIGAAARNGSDPAEVYRRPFVTVWSALDHGTPWKDAVAEGRARATSTAATDIQLAARGTFAAVQDLDDRIRGYRRRPDAGACAFCLMVAGAFVKSATAMALHPHCGCSLAPELQDAEATPPPVGVAVHEHGELGPVLAAPGQHFTTEQQLH